MAQKRVFVIVALGLFLVGLGVLPVTADTPVRFTDSATFTDVDPCTGLLHELTINFEISEHQGHAHNFVGHVRRTGTTDAGYVMDHGVENFVLNENVAKGEFTDIWHNPNGSKFKVQGSFLFDFRTGAVLVDNGSFECIGN